MSRDVFRSDVPVWPFADVDRPELDPRQILLGSIVLLILVGAYAVFFGWLSIQRYEAFQMHALDMGNMGQAAWNTLHGHPFWFTNMRLPYAIEAWGTTTRLSFHVEPLFPVISIFYLLYPHPETLLVLQTLALAIGAWPVYLLARDALKSIALALTFALGYLLSPTLEGMNLYEFHPVALATPLLLFAFLFAWRRQYLLFVLFSVLAMATKEQIGLIVMMLGLYVAFVNRDRLVGLLMAGVGLVWSLVAVLIIEPHFRHPGTVTYAHARYSYLGTGIHGAINTVLRHPDRITAVLFIWPKLGYLLHLLLPVGFLAVLAPLALLLGLPTFVLNLFSTDYHMYSALGDNSAELVAVVMIAGILGASIVLALLQRWFSHRTASLLLAAYVLVAALLSQRLDGFTPLGWRFAVPSVGQHERLENRFVAMVPASAPISTQDLLDPHLSSRRYLYLFDDTGRHPPLTPANYILLDASAATYPLPSNLLYLRARSWLGRPGWGIAAARDGLLLIKKGAVIRQLPSRFFSYLNGAKDHIAHPMSAHAGGLQVLGYNLERRDIANYRNPPLGFTLYMRPSRRLGVTLVPVVYEVMGTRLIDCVHSPYGLGWLPTSKWQPAHVYAVHMDSLQMNSNVPGTARLWLELKSMPIGANPTCPQLWQTHGTLSSLGTATIGI